MSFIISASKTSGYHYRYNFKIKINIPVNKVQFKSLKGKKNQDFIIGTSSDFTRNISQERKKNIARRFKMVTAYLHVFFIRRTQDTWYNCF